MYIKELFFIKIKFENFLNNKLKIKWIENKSTLFRNFLKKKAYESVSSCFYEENIS